jgi:hypothetical protein
LAGGTSVKILCIPQSTDTTGCFLFLFILNQLSSLPEMAAGLL